MKRMICLLAVCLMLYVMPVDAFADADVAAMLEQLPTVEQFQKMDADAQLEAYNRTQAAYDAYMALDEGERAEIPGAEETFETLFAHFNSLVMPVEEVAEEADDDGQQPPMILIAAAAFVAGFVLRNLKKR